MSTLTTRLFRARALLDVGREGPARIELSAVAEGYAAAKGLTHWWVAAVRVDEIGALMVEGENGFAGELEGLAERLAGDVYPHAATVLRARYRLARCLIKDGKKAEARKEIENTLATAAKAGVEHNRYVFAMRRLLADPDSAEPWPP